MGDIVLDCWVGNQSLYLDVSVVNRVAATYVNAAQIKTGAITKREEEKRLKYREFITGENAKLFQLIVCETFGGWKKESMMLFKRISEALAERNFTEPKVEMRKIMTELSCRCRDIMERMYGYAKTPVNTSTFKKKSLSTC
jgi:hypothetical protein